VNKAHLNIYESVPTAKKTTRLHDNDQLVVFREKIAVYSQDHTKRTNTICGQIAELLIVKSHGTYTYHCALKGKEQC
jgi:hypothetical protein